MPEFTYEALSKLGQRSTGALTATSEREAASMLDARGLFLLRPRLRTQYLGFGRPGGGKYLRDGVRLEADQCLH